MNSAYLVAPSSSQPQCYIDEPLIEVNNSVSYDQFQNVNRTNTKLTEWNLCEKIDKLVCSHYKKTKDRIRCIEKKIEMTEVYLMKIDGIVQRISDHRKKQKDQTNLEKIGLFTWKRSEIMQKDYQSNWMFETPPDFFNQVNE